jgi:hypothetical protein
MLVATVNGELLIQRYVVCHGLLDVRWSLDSPGEYVAHIGYTDEQPINTPATHNAQNNLAGNNRYWYTRVIRLGEEMQEGYSIPTVEFCSSQDRWVRERQTML